MDAGSQLCSSCQAISWNLVSPYPWPWIADNFRLKTAPIEIKELLTLRQRLARAISCRLCKILSSFIKRAGIGSFDLLDRKVILRAAYDLSRPGAYFWYPEGVDGLLVTLDGLDNKFIITSFPKLSQYLPLRRPGGHSLCESHSKMQDTDFCFTRFTVACT